MFGTGAENLVEAVSIGPGLAPSGFLEEKDRDTEGIMRHVQDNPERRDARIKLGIYGHVVGDELRKIVQNRSQRLVN